MSFKLDYRSLRNINLTLSKNANTWSENVEGVLKAIEMITSSKYIEGAGGKAVNEYLTDVHGFITASLNQLLTFHGLKFGVFYDDFLNSVDSNPDTCIESEEIKNISSLMKKNKTSALGVEDAISSSLRSVSDIFQCARRDIYDVNALHDSIVNHINDVQNNVISVDNRHVNSDFEETTQLISALKNFIDECSCKTRSFKRNYNDNSLKSISSFSALLQAITISSEKLDREYDSYIEANENVIKSIEELNEIEKKEAEEREKRQRLANIIKFAVATVAVVASVAVVVATAGAASPLLLGTVGAITAVATTATNKLADEYAEYGTFKYMNKKDFAIDLAVSGATGFITGYVGGAFTKGMSNTKTIGGLMDSSSKIVKFASNTVVDMVGDTGIGIINRGVKEFGDIGKENEKFEVEKIFDGKEILKDAGDSGIKSVVGKITEGVGNTDTAKKFLNSEDKTKRVISKAIQGGVEDTVSGIGERAYNAVIDDKNVIKESIDVEEMANDFIKGGTNAGAKEYTSHGQRIEEDDLKNNSVKNSIPDRAPDAQKWLDNGGKIYKDSDGNYIYEEKPRDKGFSEPFKLKWKEDVPETKFYDGSSGKIDYEKSTAGKYTRVYNGEFVGFKGKDV